jgi:hypothetical protein
LNPADFAQRGLVWERGKMELHRRSAQPNLRKKFLRPEDEPLNYCESCKKAGRDIVARSNNHGWEGETQSDIPLGTFGDLVQKNWRICCQDIVPQSLPLTNQFKQQLKSISAHSQPNYLRTYIFT